MTHMLPVGDDKTDEIPVMRPRLPQYEQLAEYLKQIDENRTYTNYGPLQELLTTRLAEYFGVRHDQVLLLANGTLALQGAVEVATPSSQNWVIPSWTFVASAEAVASAHCEVVFGDVDASTWTLQMSEKSSGQSHMVVSPFGAGLQLTQWQKFRAETPLLFDAASCFDACKNLEYRDLSRTAIMVSLHATKLVTTGEGGILIGDSAWIDDVKRWSNFGFRGRRVADIRGTNAKLSEYGAAIGLASFDQWEATRSTLLTLTCQYIDALQTLGLSVQPGLSDGFVSSTLVARFPNRELRDSARDSLERHRIATRAWWSEGVHRMKSFADCTQREKLAVTEELAEVTLGLPFFVDMSDAQLARVFEVLENVLS